jgi:hypothetical protein
MIAVQFLVGGDDQVTAYPIPETFIASDRVIDREKTIYTTRDAATLSPVQKNLRRKFGCAVQAVTAPRMLRSSRPRMDLSACELRN